MRGAVAERATGDFLPSSPEASRPGAALAWSGDPASVWFSGPGLRAICRAIDRPVHLLRAASGAIGATVEGALEPGASRGAGFAVAGVLPPLHPEWLGDRSFAAQHGTRFPYAVGEMAHAIAGAGMVVAAGRAGMLGFLGTAGLAPPRIEAMAGQVAAALSPDGLPWGANLIHSPAEPGLEMALADLYIGLGVARVSASAFMSLTPALVRLAASGLRRDAAGRVVRPRQVFAKISRPETARLFLSLPPEAMLRALVASGHLSEGEAAIAAGLPIAEDVTVEADSGGHTDNRPLAVLLPRVMALRDALCAAQGHGRPVRVGAAGGLGTPQAVAAAFGLGADYVLTGSVNQACAESGLSEDARAMLAGADVADTAMAASADMFELGVRVQVLRRGTLYAARANRLHDLYARHEGLDALPTEDRSQIERDLFRAPLSEIWDQTRAYFEARDPGQIARAEADPKHRMALVFRWYLGNSVHWAIRGAPERRLDYQIWCGPALGAFNAWTRGSFLEDPAERTVEQVGLNLLTGAAVALRAQALRASGVAVPPDAFAHRPERLA